MKSTRAVISRWRRVAMTALLCGGLVLAGCGDAGPSGPGTLTAEIEGASSSPGLGAVVLVVTGPGITGFSAGGSMRLFHPEITESAEAHRIVVLTSSPASPFVFEIQTADVGRLPEIVILDGAGGDNALLDSEAIGALSVKISR